MYNSGEFVRTSYCSSCPPSFCPKPFRCPVGQKCPTNTSRHRFSFLPPSAAGNCSTSDGSGMCAADWCGARLDPEGTLSSMPTIVTTYIGYAHFSARHPCLLSLVSHHRYHFGMILQHFPSPEDRLKQWVPQALVLLVSGCIVQAAWWPASKQLWSPAYTLVMAGANGIFLAVFYCLLDFTAWQPSLMQMKWKPHFSRWIEIGPTDVLRPFVWVGMNTIFVYLLSPAGGLWESMQGYVYWDTEDSNLIDATFNHVFCKDPVAQVGGKSFAKSECYPVDDCR